PMMNLLSRTKYCCGPLKLFKDNQARPPPANGVRTIGVRSKFRPQTSQGPAGSRSSARRPCQAHIPCTPKSGGKLNSLSPPRETKQREPFLSCSWPSPQTLAPPAGPRGPAGDGNNCYDFLAGGCSGFGALSPIIRTLLSRSDICMPESASKRAGTCAAILVTSPVSLYAPAASPLPVETMVTFSTLLSGSARARTISGSPVNSLSMTAAWLYSWKASALMFMALASASPFLKMISASASPCEIGRAHV